MLAGRAGAQHIDPTLDVKGESGIDPALLDLDDAFRSQLETRAGYGFTTDPLYVAALLDSNDNAGRDIGIPLTASEREYVDTFADFAAAARGKLLPTAERIPTFVDAYFDHRRNGLLILQFTSIDAAQRDSLIALAPEGPGVEIAVVERTMDQLQSAMLKVWDLWPGVHLDQLEAVSVNPLINGLSLEVSREGAVLAQELIAPFSDALGVDLDIEIEKLLPEATCTSTSNCYSPMKAGIRIYGPTISETWICTMGFHVQVGSDEQFVTAGHCAYSYLPVWEHPLGTDRGSRTATQYYSNGRDIQRVQMSDSQDSSVLYASATAVTSALDVYLGEPICASRGWSSSAWGCGVVQDNVTSWIGDKCSCTIIGGDSSVSGQGGDSGSPMVDGGAKSVGLGILNRASGEFARLDDALDAWGITVRTP